MDSLETEMQLYRNGMAPLPERYIELHKAKAFEHLDLLTKHGYVIVSSTMVNDGWCDGMKVLEVTAFDKNYKPAKIRWSDSNNGSWFLRLPSGGQVLLTLSSDKV